MFCSQCGAENDEGAKFCGKCGVATGGAGAQSGGTQAVADPPPAPAATPVAGVRVAEKTYAQEKNAVLATVLSVIIPGVGQFYNGDVKKGALMLIASLVIGPITLGLAWFGIAIWSAIDAYQVAERKTPLWT